jgi:DNA-binding transcriptional ArsR family regulator
MTIMINKGIDEKNNYKQMAQVLRAMAHPIRLQMLLGLCNNECNVNKVWQQLKISQPLASQHLIKMRKTGLITATRKGKQICYQVKDARVKKLIQQMRTLFGVAEPCKLSKED